MQRGSNREEARKRMGGICKCDFFEKGRRVCEPTCLATNRNILLEDIPPDPLISGWRRFRFEKVRVASLRSANHELLPPTLSLLNRDPRRTVRKQQYQS